MQTPMLTGPWPSGTNPRRMDAYIAAFAPHRDRPTHRHLADLLVGRDGWAVGIDDESRIEWLLDPGLNRDSSLAVTVCEDDPELVAVYRPDYPILAHEPELLRLPVTEFRTWLTANEASYRHDAGWIRSASWRLVRTAANRHYGDAPLTVLTIPDVQVPQGEPGSGMQVFSEANQHVVVTYGRRKLLRDGVWSGIELSVRVGGTDLDEGIGFAQRVFTAMDGVALPQTATHPVTFNIEDPAHARLRVRVENDPMLSDTPTRIGLSKVYQVAALS